MNLLSLIPAKYRLVTTGLLLAAVAGAGAALVRWGLSPRIQLEAERAGHAEQSLAEARQLIELQAGMLTSQQAQIGTITEIERQMRALGQDITRNAQDHSRAIEELKRNDQVVADYLRGTVPVALGRLYERPETTAPGTYRSSALLPTGSVPVTGPASGVGK